MKIFILYIVVSLLHFLSGCSTSKVSNSESLPLFSSSHNFSVINVSKYSSPRRNLYKTVKKRIDTPENYIIYLDGQEHELSRLGYGTEDFEYLDHDPALLGTLKKQYKVDYHICVWLTRTNDGSNSLSGTSNPDDHAYDDLPEEDKTSATLLFEVYDCNNIGTVHRFNVETTLNPIPISNSDNNITLSIPGSVDMATYLAFKKGMKTLAKRIDSQ